MATNRRFFAFGVAGLVVALAVAGGIWWQMQPPPPEAPDALAANQLPIGFKAYDPPMQMGDVTFEDADGKTVQLADFHGRPVVLNIWAKWCAPCVVELPQLNKLQASVPATALAVVAVAVDEPDPEKVRNFLANRDLTALHPYLDPNNVFKKVLAIHSIPVSVLIDRNGFALARADAPIAWFSDEAIQFLKRSIM
jgi:thiol-disulfide isomerase/thioredoxin